MVWQQNTNKIIKRFFLVEKTHNLENQAFDLFELNVVVYQKLSVITVLSSDLFA